MKKHDLTNTDAWAPLEKDSNSQEKIWSKPISFANDVIYRFTHKPTALFGIILLFISVIFCLIGPSLTGHNYDRQNLSFVNMPPVFSAKVVGERYIYLTQNLKLVEVAPDGSLVSQLERISENGMKKQETFDLGDGEEIILNYKAKPPQLQNSQGEVYSATKNFTNKTYILGTDHLGRDVLTRIMVGMRISLLIAFIAAIVNLVIGVMYGGLSGYLGGTVDSILMRIVDIVSTIPLTLYVILIQVLLGNTSGIISIVIALGSVYWVNMARNVRSQILSIKEQDFVLASLTFGSSTQRILFSHLIPNSMGTIIVTVTMLIPNAIFIEAFMSFIGLGVMPPMASLGTMCNDALSTLRSAPYQLFFPALAICLIMFAFNFIGDGLRDALDPKLRK